MPVTGIGGFFFRANDPAALTSWYEQHLGVIIQRGCWEQEAGQTIISPFKPQNDYFALDKQWMLNLRVTGLDEFLAKLAAAGIASIRNAEWDAQGLGRFARIHDPEGNAIELWEPG